MDSVTLSQDTREHLASCFLKRVEQLVDGEITDKERDKIRQDISSDLVRVKLSEREIYVTLRNKERSITKKPETGYFEVTVRRLVRISGLEDLNSQKPGLRKKIANIFHFLPIAAVFDSDYLLAQLAKNQEIVHFLQSCSVESETDYFLLGKMQETSFGNTIRLYRETNPFIAAFSSQCPPDAIRAWEVENMAFEVETGHILRRYKQVSERRFKKYQKAELKELCRQAILNY